MVEGEVDREQTVSVNSMSDDELKKWFKSECTKDFEKHYPVKTLTEMGFFRRECKCGQWYWTVNKDQKICGEPACSGGFTFIGDSPAKKKLDYIFELILRFL